MAGETSKSLARAIGVGIGVSAVFSLVLLVVGFIMNRAAEAFQYHEVRLDQSEQVIVGHVNKADEEHEGYDEAFKAIQARHEKDVGRLENGIDKMERRIERQRTEE